MDITLSVDRQNQVLTYEQKKTVDFYSVRTNIKDNWCSLDVDEAAKLLTNGYSWSSTHFVGGLGAKSFVETKTIGLDIDSIDAPTPKQAIAKIKSWFNAEPAIVYNTLGSNGCNNKYRVILNCDELIKDKQVALSILEAFNKELKTDSSCVDVARVFYGSTPDKLISVSNSVISTEILTEFGRPYYKKERVRLGKVRKQTSNRLQWIKELDYDTQLETKIAIKKLYNRLVTLWCGSGYESLFKAVNFFAIDLRVELNEDQFVDTCLTIFNKAVEVNPEWHSSKHISNAEDIIIRAYNYAQEL